MLRSSEILLEGDHRVSPAGHVPAEALTEVIHGVRRFQDALAGAMLTQADIEPLTTALAAMTARLRPRQVPDGEQDFSNRFDAETRGQSLTPWYDLVHLDRTQLRAHVEFGRFFTGRVSAHGGAIPLLFDDLLGMLAGAGGRPPARTAYLNVNFRSAVPIDVRLTFEATIVLEEGRKRLLRGVILDGEVVCAEAESLFVALRQGTW